jgi:ABC-type multidrug transport system fused ATPase/permease subunit
MLLAFLAFVSPVLTGVVLLGVALIHIMGGRLSERFRRLSGEVTHRNQLLAARMFHIVGAWRLIRLFDRHDHEAQRFARTSEELRQAGLDLQKGQAGVAPVMEVAQTTLFMVVILMAALSGVSFATAASFMFLLYRLEPQVRHAQAALADLKGRAASLDAVQELLEIPQQVRPASGAAPAPARIASGIRFEAVSVRYGGGAPALHEASFELPAGCSLAIIGRSGSGKSTVANLLCGLIQPSGGRILVDGVPLDRIDRSSWLSRIAVVSPELDLFEGSVAENILYGAPEAGLREVEEAARAADAHGFVSALSGGYEALVGDRGVTLSAGQRQRIALARALIRKPALLILDEATNSLDLLSEAAVMGTVDSRRGWAMTVIISHHASSIRSCDGFVRLEAGRVADLRHAQELDDAELAALLETAAAAE